MTSRMAAVLCAGALALRLDAATLRALISFS
jgi:hypothetical protein